MPHIQSPTYPDFCPEALAYSLDRISRTLATVQGFPELARDGAWSCHDDGWWTGGHWTGLLWLAYGHTNNPALAHAAREWTDRLAPRQNDTTTHDLGFLFELSHVIGYQLTGDPALPLPALAAARTLAARYNPRGRYIHAWGPIGGTRAERGRAIVDTIMNLALLYWANRMTREQRLADVATAVAQTVRERHLRPDGSSVHVVDFDPDTGAFLKPDTAQGLSATSCWARGQGWVIHGFASCYRDTGRNEFLDVARRAAEYVLRYAPPDRVPYWDYDSPLIPDDVRDSSAAAAMAAGMLRLAGLDPDPTQAAHWRAQAIAIVRSLWENYSSRGTPEPCILLHATRSKPEGAADHGLIYGDYYFVHALTQLMRPDLGL